MTNLSNIAILFDYDDTLVMTKKCKSGALKELAHRFYQIELNDERIDRYWGLPYQQFLESLFYPLDINLEQLRQNYRSLSRKYPMKAYDQSVEVIKKLQKKYLTGIVTAGATASVMSQLSQLGFSWQNFAFIQTADDTQYHKPDPRVFDPCKEIIKNVANNVSSIYYVGDSLRDQQAALVAGFYFIAMVGNTTPKKYFSAEKTQCIYNISELLNIFQ